MHEYASVDVRRIQFEIANIRLARYIVLLDT
jgi:hypothetical protein